jgi:hypothetical protein
MRVPEGSHSMKMCTFFGLLRDSQLTFLRDRVGDWIGWESLGDGYGIEMESEFFFG